MSTENIVKNKYYRILKDKTNAIWDRISFWTHADDVELSSGTSLSSDLTAKQTKIDATQSDFAQVETSPTTHAYTKGQMLIYNNQLYRVKAAIAVGNTLTEGTNIELVSVSTLSSMLTANTGNAFYFDVKDGKYGFYPTASKTASQFVPFGGTTSGIVSEGCYLLFSTSTPVSETQYTIGSSFRVNQPSGATKGAIINCKNSSATSIEGGDTANTCYIIGIKNNKVTSITTVTNNSVSLTNYDYLIIVPSGGKTFTFS